MTFSLSYRIKRPTKLNEEYNLGTGPLLFKASHT